jgi:hypothetical protein
VSEHTPGPWKIAPGEYNDPDQGEGDAWGSVITEDPAGWYVATVEYHPGDGDPEANARLIAAAPDLLWALRVILDDLPSKRDWLDPDVEKAARAAIARATEQEATR